MPEMTITQILDTYGWQVAVIAEAGMCEPTAMRRRSADFDAAVDICDAMLSGWEQHPSWPPTSTTLNSAHGIRVWRELMCA